ncbi:amidohydrolase [Marixanthomonas sp. SCSIO 43207]|uniref:amidohydrolase n=1 Tax=Marixanthomonas sp. SCSIO 43207 TaxID=2779360 RepID=UPI001CA7C92C|nr:amidohydrolase [Marixanthomonas sp. SCSIO 43207]UAB80129.1 amidohydrolase [Marixanthomonas sp. SCSIO 43207]
MKKFFTLAFVLLVLACAPEKIPADLLVKNATIYTVNENFDVEDAFVVRDGKILEIGLKPELELKYKITETYDAKGKTIVPGLIDAHAHLYGLGLNLQDVDLTETTSYDEVLARVIAFQKEKKKEYIIGRGWDQNDWEVKEFPTKKELDSLFPNTPVALTRIDGHAMIVNSKALQMAGITPQTKIEGGVIGIDNGKLTGILVDSPMSIIEESFPKQNRSYNKQALLDAERISLQYGLTTVNDAGLDREIIELIDSLQKQDSMALRVYAMVSNKPKNLDFYLSNGKIKTNRLNVRSVKVYADGALGSRGAALRDSYSDMPGHFGAMITPADSLQKLANRIYEAGYQMNTHAIGDSANIAVLRAYESALKDKTDARWKIEHAQIISKQDFSKFSKNIIPSVQPTHATSDMYWAEDRIGSKRIQGAYAYKTLLENTGIIVLGTDFPVEQVNPMYTFYAAVARKDLKQFPEGGFQKKDALTREEALKGMTIWAAYSNFEEAEKGSLEEGKLADFTVLDRDIMTVAEDSIPNTKVLATFINGKKEFSLEEE